VLPSVFAKQGCQWKMKKRGYLGCGYLGCGYLGCDYLGCGYLGCVYWSDVK